MSRFGYLLPLVAVGTLAVHAAVTSPSVAPLSVAQAAGAPASASVPTVTLLNSTPVSVPTVSIPVDTPTPVPTPVHKVKRRKPRVQTRPTATPTPQPTGQWIWAYLTSYCPGSAGWLSSSGIPVYYGMLANNYYPFGTRVYLPVLGITGVVEDRLSAYPVWNHFDVWSATCYGTPTGWFRAAIQ